MSVRLVDTRGMRCPWPALRLAKAMRDVPAGGSVRILADDPAAPREIMALASQQGWRTDPDGDGLIVIK